MKLVLVNKKDESGKVKSFYFQPDQKFKFKAGQYIYLDLSPLKYHDPKGPIRQFTVSSSPTDKHIRITTNISGSGFKKTLDDLNTGQEVLIKGPLGHFYFDNESKKIKSHVFIAGGIGITPFISIIENVHKLKLKNKIYLIYSNSGSNFIFQDDLEKITKKNSSIKIRFIDSQKEGRLNKHKLKSMLSGWQIIDKEKIFWVVGSNKFVDSIESYLEGEVVKTEKFTGL